jgi:hypothetical protein
MTLDELKALAETWGGDIARWPERTRGEADALAQTPAAREVLEEARRLDRLIAGAAPEIDDDRVNRAMFQVATRLAAAPVSVPARPRFGLLPLTRWLAPAASFACAAVVGASLAFVHPLALARPPGHAGNVLTLLLDAALLDHDWVTR